MTRAVLFDIDGTLIDSNDAHARAWVAALAEAGYDVPFERIRPMIGMGGDRILPEVTGGLRDDSPEGQALSKRRMAIFFSREFDALRATRGARALLEAVRARGARVVIATSAKKEELDRLLAVGDFGPLVDVASTSDDAAASKPAPDVVHAALDKAGMSPGDAVMVGDTRFDVEAAHRAGVPCVALRCGGNDPASLAGADAVYADPAELISALDRPPFGFAAASQSAPAESGPAR
jgi:HAD superfamily hydrolase (TIGR01549 family)